MMLLEVTASTWIITGLGFGLVLVLLFCFVFIMKGLGWIMSKISGPKEPKATKPTPTKTVKSAVPTDEGTMAAIAMALAEASDDDKVAIATALYLYYGKSHDVTTNMIARQARSTAWNDKSFGLNNKGF